LKRHRWPVLNNLETRTHEGRNARVWIRKKNRWMSNHVRAVRTTSRVRELEDEERTFKHRKRQQTQFSLTVRTPPMTSTSSLSLTTVVSLEERGKANCMKTSEEKLRLSRRSIVSRSSAASRTHEDPLHQKLKAYHDRMLNTLSNTTTEKLSQEVADVLTNPAAVSDCDRPFVWSKPEEERLNELNVRCKELKTPREWTWAAADDTPQGTFNDIRMQWYVRKELQVRIIECPECKSNGILVGLEQIEAAMCYDCVQLGRANKEEKRTKKEAWEKVRPVSKDYPKRTERGREMEDLAELFPGDKAVLAPCFAVVTIQKRFYSGRKASPGKHKLGTGPGTDVV
jgi:hypothetical protein